MKTLKALALIASSVMLTSTSAMADETLDRILAEGKTVVATEAALEPYEFVRDGQIVGYGADILAEVIKDLGVDMEQLDLPFQGILAGLAAGQYDFVATTIAVNPERAKIYGFTRPIGAAESVMIVATDNADIASPEDAAGRLVGTQSGSSEEAKATAFREQLVADGKDDFTDIRYFQSFPDVIFALRSGQIDAAVVGLASAVVFEQREPGVIKNIGAVGDPAYLSWATRANDVDLRAAINATIGRLVDSGEIGELQDKWFGFRMPTPAEGYLPEGSIN